MNKTQAMIAKKLKTSETKDYNSMLAIESRIKKNECTKHETTVVRIVSKNILSTIKCIRINALKDRMNMVIKKIRPQFGSTHEANLMFGVVETALYDSVEEDSRYEPIMARKYLCGEILHASICGVDTDWIRDLIRKVGLGDLVLS